MDRHHEVSGCRPASTSAHGRAVAVDGLGFALGRGQTLGIVGESGSGKGISALAVMGLVPSPPGRVTGGSIRFGAANSWAWTKRSCGASAARTFP